MKTYVQELVHFTNSRIKWFWQRRTRGFDDTELWSLDHTLAEFMLPRIRAFRANGPAGTPGIIAPLNQIGDDQAYEQWLAILDDITFMFEMHVEHGSWAEIPELVDNAEDAKRYAQGLKYFTKYWRCLWD